MCRNRSRGSQRGRGSPVEVLWWVWKAGRRRHGRLSWPQQCLFMETFPKPVGKGALVGNRRLQGLVGRSQPIQGQGIRILWSCCGICELARSATPAAAHALPKNSPSPQPFYRTKTYTRRSTEANSVVLPAFLAVFGVPGAVPGISITLLSLTS